jgi:hypothetical protein
MGRHLYPVGKLPEDIKNLLQFHFGAAHLDTERQIVEVGAQNGTKYNDMWFSYRLVREANNNTRGVLETPFLMPGWYVRSKGKVADCPSTMRSSLRSAPLEE